jgi:hypothetical protein
MPDEEDEPTTQERSFFSSRLGRVLLVIVPAMIAGAFSIAPKLYDELTRSRAVLSYAETSGPAINTNGGFRQIFSLTVENPGRLPLTGVQIDINVPTGAQIESSAIERSAGLSPVVSSGNDAYVAHLDRFLPTETMGISIMTGSNAPDVRLRINLRSNEVLGARRSIDLSTRNDLFGLVLSGGLAAASVALSFVLMMRLAAKRSIERFLRLPIHSDSTRFIAAMSEVPNLPRSVLYGGERLSFIGAADLFLDAGLNGEKTVRERCVLALKALLAASPRTASSSLDAIRVNLEALGCHLSRAEYDSLRNQAKRSESIFDFRKRMLVFFSGPVPAPSQATKVK